MRYIGHPARTPSPIRMRAPGSGSGTRGPGETTVEPVSRKVRTVSRSLWSTYALSGATAYEGSGRPDETAKL